MRTFSIKQGDTAPALTVTLYGGTGAVQALTGATVKFNLRRASDGVRVIDHGAVTLIDAANGVVAYHWGATDTAIAGTYAAEFEVTFADGTIETYPNDSDYAVFIVAQVG